MRFFLKKIHTCAVREKCENGGRVQLYLIGNVTHGVFCLIYTGITILTTTVTANFKTWKKMEQFPCFMYNLVNSKYIFAIAPISKFKVISDGWLLGNWTSIVTILAAFWKYWYQLGDLQISMSSHIFWNIAKGLSSFTFFSILTIRRPTLLALFGWFWLVGLIWLIWFGRFYCVSFLW